MSEAKLNDDSPVSEPLTRRRLLSGIALSTAGLSLASSQPFAQVFAQTPAAASLGKNDVRRLRAFDYRGVRLLDSPWRQQMMATRDMYYNMNNDDMLKGFRRNAGLPAPGHDMAGWAARSTSATFGQWLSGYARLGCALQDSALHNKCLYLISEYEKTIGADGNPRIRGVYGWEKLACGLVDAARYADFPHAIEILDRITSWASRNFDRSRVPAGYKDRAGRGPGNTNEWYTLAENLYRAYEMSGNKQFLDFAAVWLYPDFWNKFASTSTPEGVAFLHAYSHVNSFNSAAMAYAVLQKPEYLTILRNGYDWVRSTQAYASGGYGPGEWTVAADGSLGDALDVRNDHAEIPCGTWAGFKLSRHLMEFTGEARFGDWMEDLLYNGIGAALLTQPDGATYYYADYHLGMATKIYYFSQWPCCSGTYLQDVADYHNIVYYHDEGGLYINLLLPSELEWQVQGVKVQLTQQTNYPGTEESQVNIVTDRPVEFSLSVRVPSWCSRLEVDVNGERSHETASPGQWLRISRSWHADKVILRFPMAPRAVAVDRRHPNRIAVKYGPLLMAQDARYTFPIRGDQASVLSGLSRTSTLPELHMGPVNGAIYNPEAISSDVNMANGEKIGPFVPFYTLRERMPYRIYFDLDRHSFF
ncbi:MAG: beta-L-arabinofuranosidase domain-containing protein [Acidobacteriota bacterium]